MFTFGISTIITDNADVFTATKIIGNSSFKFVEIRCEKGHFEYEDKAEIKKVKKTLKEKNLSGIALHPPVWIDIGNREEWTRMKSLREAEKVILVANRLGVPRIILHPGKKNSSIEKAIQSIDELSDFAEEWGVKILLENTIPGDLGSNIDELQTLSDKFNLPICLDTSHASAKENILNKILEIFGGKIGHFHLSDSMMKGSDDHLMPCDGKIDWKPVVNFMRAHKGFAVFEVPSRDNKAIIENMEEIKRQWKNNKVCP